MYPGNYPQSNNNGPNSPYILNKHVGQSPYVQQQQQFSNLNINYQNVNHGGQRQFQQQQQTQFVSSNQPAYPVNSYAPINVPISYPQIPPYAPTPQQNVMSYKPYPNPSTSKCSNNNFNCRNNNNNNNNNDSSNFNQNKNRNNNNNKKYDNNNNNNNNNDFNKFNQSKNRYNNNNNNNKFYNNDNNNNNNHEFNSSESRVYAANSSIKMTANGNYLSNNSAISGYPAVISVVSSPTSAAYNANININSNAQYSQQSSPYSAPTHNTPQQPTVFSPPPLQLQDQYLNVLPHQPQPPIQQTHQISQKPFQNFPFIPPDLETVATPLSLPVYSSPFDALGFGKISSSNINSENNMIIPDQCTFLSTGRNFSSVGEFYICHTCSKQKNKYAICGSCAHVCHAGHSVERVSAGASLKAFCDCGANDIPNQQCKLIPSDFSHCLSDKLKAQQQASGPDQVYYCRTCGITSENNVICKGCASICHKGHDIYSAGMKHFCTCSNCSSCKLIPK